MFHFDLVPDDGEGEAAHGAPDRRSVLETPLQAVPLHNKRQQRDLRGGRAPSPALQVVDAEGVLPEHGAGPRRDRRHEGRRLRPRALLQRLRGPAGRPHVCLQVETKEASHCKSLQQSVTLSIRPTGETPLCGR